MASDIILKSSLQMQLLAQGQQIQGQLPGQQQVFTFQYFKFMTQKEILYIYKFCHKHLYIHYIHVH